MFYLEIFCKVEARNEYLVLCLIVCYLKRESNGMHDFEAFRACRTKPALLLELLEFLPL